VANHKLDWKQFDWVHFQNMTIYIALDLYPNYRFEEYLKQGNKQEGIDVVGYKLDNSVVAIQCKKVDKITKGDLQIIVNEFADGEFGKRAKIFILCTNVNLQTEVLQREIRKHKTSLGTKGIFFDCWDVTALETELKKYPNYVARYFSLEQAERFCIPQLKIAALDNIKELPDYIPRQVYQSDNRKFQDLAELILKNPQFTRKSCLVGEAHYGKSSYLKQLAYLLKRDGKGIQPIFMEIKDGSVQPFENLLNQKFGFWKQIPLSDLVLIVDGLDEAPTTKFDDILVYLNEFSQSYPGISMIISCRQVFYNKYLVKDTLTDFQSYVLGPLSDGEAIRYIEKATGGRYGQFREAVNRLYFGSLLLHPFFLVYVVKKFIKAPDQMPSGKIQILNDFIGESFKTSESRKMGNSQRVGHENVLFNEVIRQFALALQIAGTNAMSDQDLQQLFTFEQRALLEHSSLVSSSNATWSFTNAIFQEHLAASKLMTASFEDIAALCSIGTRIRKIRTKWIQTLSSLLSILNYKSELYQQLLKFIEADNIELIFLTDFTSYPEDFKLDVFKRLMERYADQHIGPMLINEETISHFVEDVEMAKSYCMDLIESQANERLKATACRILRASAMSEELLTRFAGFVLKEVMRTDDAFYAGLLVEVLAVHQRGNREFVESLIQIEKHRDDHNFLDKVYALISALQLSDDFYSFAIAGIPKLITHNQQISHFGSEFNLQDLLLGTESTQHLKLLFKAMQTEGWLNFYRFKNDYGVSFMSRLSDKCIEMFKKVPLVIILVADFIRHLGRQYLRDDFKEIDRIIVDLKANHLLIRLFSDEIFQEKNWELATFITPDCFDFLLYEYEEGEYEPEVLKICINALRYRKLDQIAGELYNMCAGATGGAIIEDTTAYVDYQRAEQQKLANDLKYIRSSKTFKKGVEDYFQAFGKKVISEDDLYIDFTVSQVHRQVDSNFIYHALLGFARNNRKIYLKECLEVLAVEKNFEWVRAGLILGYNYKTTASDKVLLPILEKYYLKTLQIADFGNEMTNREVRLGEIFMKFKFMTPEPSLMDMIWLDFGGIRSIQDQNNNRATSISQSIIAVLDEEGKERFKTKILANLNHGIAREIVLGTHIGLCRYLLITESKNFLLGVLQSGNFHNLYLPDVADIYLELGGNKKNLLPVFSAIVDFERDLYLPLAKHLAFEFPNEVTGSLLTALKKEIDQNLKVSIARLLSTLGRMEGFTYLINSVVEQRKAPYHIQLGYQVHNVNTTQALKEMDRVGYMMVDPAYNTYPDFGESAGSMLLEWLKGFASKSEQDLNLVVDFIHQQQEKLSEKYSSTTGLNWLINNMFNDFRDSSIDLKNIKEVMDLMTKLNFL
jgi:hypothetical protein